MKNLIHNLCQKHSIFEVREQPDIDANAEHHPEFANVFSFAYVEQVGNTVIGKRNKNEQHKVKSACLVIKKQTEKQQVCAFYDALTVVNQRVATQQHGKENPE
jgi:ribosomal protein S7